MSFGLSSQHKDEITQICAEIDAFKCTRIVGIQCSSNQIHSSLYTVE